MQGFYEALHYFCYWLLPDAVWIVEMVSTGLFLINLKARMFHTQVVRLLLYNFRVLVRLDNLHSQVPPLVEKQYLSQRPLFLKHYLENTIAFTKPTVNFMASPDFFFEWFNFLKA